MKLSKNTEFSIKIIILVVLLSFLIFEFFVQYYSPKANVTGIPFYQRININYAYFTTQSNYIVVFYLFYSLFIKNSYNKRPPFGIELAVTVYISTTMIVFWLGLLASSNEMQTYNPINWICTFVLHLIIPLIMISQFLLYCGEGYYGMRNHCRFGIVGISLYPFLYCVFAVVRGELRFQEYGPDFFSKVYGYNSITNTFYQRWNEVTGGGFGIFRRGDMQPFNSQMWYPYWFMNLHTYKLEAPDENGVMHVWQESNFSQGAMICFFLMGVVIITAVVLGMQFFFIYLNNNKYYRWHDINDKPLSQEEHDYRLKLRHLILKKQRQDEQLNRIKSRLDKKQFKKELNSLTGFEKETMLTLHANTVKLQKRLERANRINKRNSTRQYRREIKSLLLNVKSNDRHFVRENIREAERYKKLVKKGVLISLPRIDLSGFRKK